MLSSLFLAASFAALSTQAKTISKDLHIVNKVIAPDGFSRSAALPGGTLPGTLITGQKGDKFHINVHNDLYDEKMLVETSVHWHGIHQRRTNWADGSATVTQCPLLSGNSFLYEFDLSEDSGSGQTGTFWYHSHLSSQYCDGLRGPLVVYDPDEPARYDYEIDDASTIITLGDWFHSYGKDFHPGASLPPSPVSTLINGKGRDPNNPTSELAVVTVEPGKRYRMRVINMACYTSFLYSVDKHSMKVIEADSIATKPHVVDSFRIFAGQRYSYVLEADQPVGNYWMRSLPERGVQKNYTNNVNVAILRYAGAPIADPTVAADTNVPALSNELREVDLEPWDDEDAPGVPELGEADVQIDLVSTFNTTDHDYTGNTTNGDLLFRMNGVTFEGSVIPILLQILSGARNPKDLMPTGGVYVLPKNKIIEVTIHGTPTYWGGPHPFHLHGHDFYLVKASGSEPKFTNTIQRDTASTGLQNDSMVIRFVSDNPGPWFLHCHLDFHLDMGMGIVFAEDTPDTPSYDDPTDAWDKLCPDYDSFTDKGGEAEDDV